jgi:hypothetical protein
MSTKSFKVLFYTTQLGANNHCLRDCEQQLIAFLSPDNHLRAIEFETNKFQIRDLNFDRRNSEWRGVFGRLRPDAPNVVDINDHENKLALNPDDLLIEKLHFIYKPQIDILIWQVNTDVGFIGRLEDYLSELFNQFFNAYIVTGNSSLSKVMNGTVKYYEVKVALPNKKLSKTPSYSQPAFDIMKGVGGSTIKYKVSAGRDSLTGNVKQLISELLGDDTTVSLKAKLDGDDEPVDLFVDRISERMSVNLNGHYPDPKDIFNMLNLAFENNKDELKDSFKNVA